MNVVCSIVLSLVATSLFILVRFVNSIVIVVDFVFILVGLRLVHLRIGKILLVVLVVALIVVLMFLNVDIRSKWCSNNMFDHSEVKKKSNS